MYRKNEESKRTAHEYIKCASSLHLLRTRYRLRAPEPQGPSGKTSRLVVEDFRCVDIPSVLSSPRPRTESFWPTQYVRDQPPPGMDVSAMLNVEAERPKRRSGTRSVLITCQSIPMSPRCRHRSWSKEPVSLTSLDGVIGNSNPQHRPERMFPE